jgi:predicted nucleic acid-binding protein
MSVEFVDTNVLVYAHDSGAGPKRKAGRDLLLRLMETGSGAISTQVLSEFLVTVTRKIPKPLTTRTAIDIVEDLATMTVVQPAVADLVAAATLAEEHHIHFWDALIIRSAQVAGANTLWSEDLSAGQDFDGVVVRNPFA